jgi:hypothetical protein
MFWLPAAAAAAAATLNHHEERLYWLQLPVGCTRALLLTLSF